MPKTCNGEHSDMDAHVLRPNPRSTVGAAAVLLTGMIALSRLTGVARVFIVAYLFGQTRHTDAYVSAFSIPDLIYFLISGGALAIGFVPVFTGYLVKGNHERAVRTFRVLFTTLATALLLAITICWLYAPQLTWLMFPGFRNEPDTLTLTVKLTRIILPAQFFFVLSGLFWGALHSLRYFFIPALQPIIYNIGIITGGVIGYYTGIGVEGLAWGALIGAIAGVTAFQVPLLIRVGLRFGLLFDWHDEGMRRVFKLVIPVILGLAISQIYNIILPRSFGSLLPSGHTTAIEFANRIMQFPVALFAMSMGIALFPTLSALAAQVELIELRQRLALALRITLMLVIPSAMLLAIMREPIIRILLEHGEFTSQDTQATARALLFYCPAIIGMACQQLVARGFYALMDTITPVGVGIGCLALAWVLSYLFIGPLQQGGLALAASIASVTNASILFALLAQRLQGLELMQLGRLLLRVTGAVGVAGAFVFAIMRSINRFIHVRGFAMEAIMVAVLGIIALLIYTAILRCLSTSEFELVLQHFAKRFRKR